MATRRGIYIEFIGDEIKYVRSAENVLKTNTKLGRSFSTVGVDATKSAEAQVAAAVKASEALKITAANLRAVEAASTGEKRVQAARLAADAEARYAASLGLTTTATRAASTAAREGERDLNKVVRGGLAGAGVFKELGRSLAFASSGFIAFAAGATLIRRSIDAATELAATQRSVAKQLQTSGKSWEQYSAQINDTDLRLSHLSGFTNQELLQSFGYLVRVSGNVQQALKLNAVAADVARGRHISLASASLALGKALGGSITALRRLGIVVPKDLKGMEALDFVARKFAGQAAANATAQEKFHATLVDTEEIIGTALLPTFERLAKELGDWFQKMNESGRMQKDVNSLVKDFGDLIHPVVGAIQDLDKVTGSFANTLKLIVEMRFAFMVAGWLGALQKLTRSWMGVAAAADTAAGAEARALGVGAAGGAGGAAAGAEAGAGAIAGVGIMGALLGRKPVPKLPAVFGQYVGTSSGLSQISSSATTAETKVAALRAGLLSLNTLTISAITIPIVMNVQQQLDQTLAPHGFGGKLISDFLVHNPVAPWRWKQTYQDFINFGRYGPAGPPPRGQFNQNPPPFPTSLTQGQGFVPGFFAPNSRLGTILSGGTLAPFGAGMQFTQISKFVLSMADQIAQAEAALTKSTADDVAEAKKIIAKIKANIAEGKYKPSALLAALQAELGAIQVVDSAAAEAAQKRKDAADKAKQLAESYEIPIQLQIQQGYAALTKSTADDVKVYKEIIAAARKTLASGKKRGPGIVALLNVIKQAQDALDQIQSTAYELPVNLRLALARAQAFGGDQRSILLKMKAALMKAYKAAKGNWEKQIAILTQITDINNQLNAGLNDAQAALGLFHQANLKKLTQGLTAADRRKMRERLAQLGPGGKVPGVGVGAAGYAINPQTDRPIIIQHTTRLDGKVIETSTTRHQQVRRNRNSKQRRGPNAGATAA